MTVSIIRLATLGLLLALALPAAPAAAAPAAAKDTPGVFVLGIDGVDPIILQRLMDAGQAPNFKELVADGSFQELGTSNPPQSPVAWSNFVTGMNPGGHGIYDFIHRDPATYMPMSSAIPPLEEGSTLELFGLCLPLGGDEVVNNRTGKPFWDYLAEAGVDVEVYRMPGNFPPTPSEALTLSGMGTDDLRMLNGKYSWYSNKIVGSTSDLKAEYVRVSPEDNDGDGITETVETRLLGPTDALQCNPDADLSTPLTVHIDPDNPVAWIRAGTSDVILPEGEWSGWVEVTFDALPMGLAPLTGMVRFYAKELRPDFQLYVSPVNFSPSAPATPITTPDDDVLLELRGELGDFYTQGMPEETNAYKDGLFDEDDFVKQVELVHEDGHRMLDLAVRRFDPGDMTFMYLSDIDLQCHMLWHLGNPKTDSSDHPAHKPDKAAAHGGDIEAFYRGVDAVLGRVRRELPPDTLLIVMSDHGFQPYTRKMNLNAWLRDEGYLVLKDDARTGAIASALPDEHGHPDWTTSQIDWSATRAYGLGFNGLYLNLQGREAGGIVTSAEAPALLAELQAKLEGIVDPKTGENVVLRAALASETYSGARVEEAPDILVGYAAGYGCSDTSTLGEVDESVLVDNLGGEFTGNHLMDPSVVPGILLVNQPLTRDGHDLTDVTASLLDYYGLPVPDDMVGESFLD